MRGAQSLPLKLSVGRGFSPANEFHIPPDRRCAQESNQERGKDHRFLLD